jgi:hypothetical protein
MLPQQGELISRNLLTIHANTYGDMIGMPKNIKCGKCGDSDSVHHRCPEG